MNMPNADDIVNIINMRHKADDYDDLHRLARDLADEVLRAQPILRPRDDGAAEQRYDRRLGLLARSRDAGLLDDDGSPGRSERAVSDPTVPTTATPSDDAEGRTDEHRARNEPSSR